MVGLKVPLVLLHTVLVSAYRWSNWQSDVTCESDAYIAPANENATASFLEEQYSRGSLIRVVGNGHGFGNLTTCVDTSRTEMPSYGKQVHTGSSLTLICKGWWKDMVGFSC